jgi:hypothetical protein
MEEQTSLIESLKQKTGQYQRKKIIDTTFEMDVLFVILGLFIWVFAPHVPTAIYVLFGFMCIYAFGYLVLTHINYHIINKYNRNFISQFTNLLRDPEKNINQTFYYYQHCLEKYIPAETFFAETTITQALNKAIDEKIRVFKENTSKNSRYFSIKSLYEYLYRYKEHVKGVDTLENSSNSRIITVTCQEKCPSGTNWPRTTA